MKLRKIIVNKFKSIIFKNKKKKPRVKIKSGKSRIIITRDELRLIIKNAKPVKYYFIIASSKFLLKNEPLEEMLRERAQFLRREKKPITFWVVKSPKFLESPQLNDLKSKITEAGLSGVELTAILSVDQTFTTWLKLRLQNVGYGDFMTGEDIKSPLASNLPV